MRHTNRPISTAVSAETIERELADGLALPSDAVARYALGLGDDALILAQRLGEWIARAPELEEDVALGNIGLDLLGHARSFLTYAGSAWGRTEDDLAYFRDEPEFRNHQLFERPNGDFAHTIARQHALLRRMAELIDRGDIVHTLTRRIDGLDAAGIAQAHALVEAGNMIGKVVVAAR